MLKTFGGLALALLLLGSSSASAQSTLLLPVPKAQFLDAAGYPLAGGSVYTYAAGTTSAQATYTDSTGGTPNTNPVVLDAGGFANIWLAGLAYHIVVKNSAAVTISDTDNVTTGVSTYLAPYVGAIARATSSKLSDFMNGKDFGVVGDGTTDDTAALNIALSAAVGRKLVLSSSNYKLAGAVSIPANTTLELNPGTYTMGNAGQFVLAGTGSKLICPGTPESTVISVPSTYTVATGAIYLSSGEPAGTVEGCEVKFAQPNDVTTRTGQIQYTAAAVYAVNQPRFRLRHLKIIGAWTAINATGTVFGSLIEDIQVSSFNAAVLVDGPSLTAANAGPLTIANLHWANFGLTANQGVAFLDANNFGIWDGGSQGMMVNGFASYGGQAFKFFTDAGVPVATITNAAVLAGNGILINSGNVTCASCTFLLNSSTAGAVVTQNSGYLALSGCSFIVGSGVPAGAGAITSVTTVATTNTSLTITGSMFLSGSADFPWVYAGSANAGLSANLTLANNFFQTTINTAFSNAKIKLDVGSRGSITNNVITDKGTGAGVFLNVIQDAYHKILGNSVVGFGITLPGSYSTIQYANNI